MYLKEGIMLQIIREFCYKMANKKFKSNLMDGAIESDRLSNDFYKKFTQKGYKVFDVNSPTLEEDVKYCRENHINYLISVQYDLIKEFL